MPLTTPKKRRKPKKKSTSLSTYSCPHCGEEVDSWPDLGGGEVQTYIEDCAVCCRPNRIHAVLESEGSEFTLTVTAEDD